MGVVHHSNYVRWLEEARNGYFASIGLAYDETERLGVMSPITDINLKYKYPARFGDIFTVKMKITKYTGVRFCVVYSVINQEGVILCEAESAHAFVNKDMKPVSLARAIPRRHEIFKKRFTEENSL
jgi:acyl-CoA thioester hydrolase